MWYLRRYGKAALSSRYCDHFRYPPAQARLGVDVEGVFRRYDPEQTGSVLRSDFVQAVMQLGIGLLESSASR